jgi:hypothetical protein
MFSDSHRFDFVDMGGVVVPVHRRELGEREGHLYSKKITWADVAWDGVCLNKTLSYENEIEGLEGQKDNREDHERGIIVVNERQIQYPPHIDEDLDTQILRRIRNMKLGPLTFKEAKKKKPSKNKRCSKPPTKVEKEKHETFTEIFQEVVDKKDHGIHEDFQLKIIPRESDCLTMYHGKKTFSPPIDWIEPVKRWDLIWSYMDTLEKGYKRNYKYTKPGCTDENGVIGPAIYFYDENDTDLNYSFNWKEDFIFSEVEYGANGEFLFYNQHTFDVEKANYVSCAPRFNMPPDFKRQPWGGYYYDEYNVVLERSNSCRLRECEKEFLEYPCEETYDRYNSQWSKWPGGNIWYRDVGQAPTPYV